MIAVGVDVGKTLLEVAIHGEVKLQRFDNTPAGVRWLVRLLEERGAQRIVVEATKAWAVSTVRPCARCAVVA